MHRSTRRTCGLLVLAAVLAAPASAHALTATSSLTGFAGRLVSVWEPALATSEETTTSAGTTTKSTSSSADAQASESSAPGCDAPASPVFAPWNDPADYKLVADGDFESGTGDWRLVGGAGLVAGGSTHGVTGAPSTKALRLPEGASATSPLTCITPGSPVARMFAATTGGSGAKLRVEVVDEAGSAKPVGNLTAVLGWDPTRRFSTSQGRLKAGDDGAAHLRVRFTAESGSWEIDDVFVDPRSLR